MLSIAIIIAIIYFLYFIQEVGAGGVVAKVFVGDVLGSAYFGVGGVEGVELLAGFYVIAVWLCSSRLLAPVAFLGGNEALANAGGVMAAGEAFDVHIHAVNVCALVHDVFTGGVVGIAGKILVNLLIVGVFHFPLAVHRLGGIVFGNSSFLSIVIS
jgi:hypothetical protein